MKVYRDRNFLFLSLAVIGSYFSAVDLASIAQDLDDVEGAHMAEGGVDSVEYLRFQEVSNIKLFE